MKSIQTAEPVVRDVMSSGVLSVYSNSNVSRAVRIMVNRNVGRVVVVGAGGPVGVFTERDLLGKVLVKHLDLATTPITKVMSPIVAKVGPAQSPQEAAKVMIDTKSTLLVFEEGQLVGIVTATDIVKAIYRIGIPLDISGVVSKDVVTVAAETPVKAVIREMATKRVGSVIVRRREAPYGIFTERDLLNRVIDADVAESTPVGDITSFRLITAQYGIEGEKVAEVMVSKKIKRLPLMQDSKIVGIVTARDLVEALAVANLEMERELAKEARVRYGELCPICNSRIDDQGLCGCGAGGA